MSATSIASDATNVQNRGPIAVSSQMQDVLQAADDVAQGNTTVLLLGESGTGKEVVARHIHRQSTRAGQPWVGVNCAAIPAELLESELFGHERGAFTGAVDKRSGRIEQANKGTLLLDEISELPLALQAKLLRVLQEREVDRVGGTKPVPVDVRIIATSNRDLEAMVATGQFRADLYYRLNVFPIVIPPLRERVEDIPALAEYLLRDAAGVLERPIPQLSTDAIEALMQYPFPGNVRELRNVLERALVRCRTAVLDSTQLRLTIANTPAPMLTTMPLTFDTDIVPHETRAMFPAELPLHLPTLERMAIEEALMRCNDNRTHAAKMLGIGLRTLRNKLRQYREEAGLAVEPLDHEEHDVNAAGRNFVPSLKMPRGDSDDDGAIDLTFPSRNPARI